MEYILYEQKGQYAIITINRERALNALNSQVLDELDKTLDGVDLNTVRCLILTGAGQKSFVAGQHPCTLERFLVRHADDFVRQAAVEIGGDKACADALYLMHPGFSSGKEGAGFGFHGDDLYIRV